MNCTRCEGTGFINIGQVEVKLCGEDEIQKWINENTDHDVSVCDCCGDGDEWHGEAGRHYTNADPMGMSGPYGYNGGVAECH